MAVYKINEDTLKGIGNQVRALTGSSGSMTPVAMQSQLSLVNSALTSELEEQAELIEELKDTLRIASVANSANITSEDEAALLTKTITSCSWPITNVRPYAFYYCGSLTTVSLPVATTIGNSAFDGCSALTTVSLPAATYIGDYAFGNCISLTTVSLPAATTISSCAFESCTSLTTVSLPAATSIGIRVFLGCSALTTVSLPAATYIGSSAFRACSKLTTLRLMNSTVCSIASTNAFINTPMSKSTYTGTFGSIYVPASLLASYKAATNWSKYSSRFVGV